MAYTKTEWSNNSQPYINADNLNKIEQGIYDNSQEISEIKDGEVCSTDEVKTNKVWVDGKPVYRKVTQTNLNLSTVGVHNFNVGLADVDSVVDIRYSLIAGNRKLTFNNAINAVGIESNTLYIYTGVNWDSSIPFTFTFEYTKTTD